MAELSVQCNYWWWVLKVVYVEARTLTPALALLLCTVSSEKNDVSPVKDVLRSAMSAPASGPVSGDQGSLAGLVISRWAKKAAGGLTLTQVQLARTLPSLKRPHDRGQQINILHQHSVVL